MRRASAGVAASGVGDATVWGGFVGVSAAFAAIAAAAAASVTGAAVIVDPTTVFARAVGVLSSAAVEAIGVEPAVTALAAGLGAGAPASVFAGDIGLNESRIFTAAAASCARMCGICSNTVSAGNRSFISAGIWCCRINP